MLYAPVIFDASNPSPAAMSSAVSIWSPATEENFGFALPLLAAGAMARMPSLLDATALAFPATSLLSFLRSPALEAKFSSLPLAQTGVPPDLARSPNPYSPEEVRRAFQLAQGTASTQAGIAATINTKLSIAQSDIVDLDGRIDAIEATTSTGYSAEADSAVVAGQSLYLKANGHVDLAKADAAGTTKVIGVAIIAAGAGFAVRYNTDGKLSLPDWTAITGAATLTPGADYYLSDATAGMLTTIAPTTVGFYLARVGRAISTLILDVEIEPSILL